MIDRDCANPLADTSSMTPAAPREPRPEWAQVDRALDALLELPPAERGAAVPGLARGDLALERELKALLALIEQPDALLDRPASQALSAPDLTTPDAADAAGSRIGPWQLIELLGRGGMGEVYRAERVDGQFELQVAIKLIRVDTAYQAARLRAERQILARLDHPGIARLLDGDVSADGRPYMVMELVQGQQIVHWCNAHGAGLERRLVLFAEVCAAVSFAHRNLIVHRDLKPANVLVTAEGRPKLLDFGIARLLESPTGEHSRDLALTPGYAAPEQFTGAPVTTATDVYALGLLLHELLCGQPAHAVQQQPLAQAIQQVLTQAAPPPSRVAAGLATPPVPARQLAGDLDAIVGKALRKEPEQRYASVDELRLDLERFRRSEPVRARPDHLMYRARKFVSRFRVELACGVLAVAALLSVTGYALVQAQAAKLATRQEAAAKDFLLRMLTGGDPGLANGRPPGEVTVQQMLDATSQSLKQGLQDQPQVKLDVLETLGSAYESIDRPAQSLDLLEQALALSERVDVVPHARQAHLLVMLADLEGFAGHYDAMRPWLDRADSVLKALRDHDSEDYTRSLTLRSGLLRLAGSAQLPAALDKLKEAVTLYRDRHPGASGRVGALMALAQVERGLDDMPAALQAANEAVTIAAQPGASLKEAANAFSLRAAIRDVVGDAAGALADYTEAAHDYTATRGAEHFLTLSNESLRGQALLRLGHEKEGLEAMQRAAETLGRTRAGSNTHAAAMVRLGVALVDLGLIERAEPVLLQAGALWQQRKDALQGSVATLALAKARHQRGDEAKAQALLEEARAVRTQREHHTVAPLSEVQLTAAQFAFDAGRLDDAGQQAQAALQSAADAGLNDQSQRIRARAVLARTALAQGDAHEALALSAGLLAAVQTPAWQGFPGLRATAFEVRGRVLCALGPAEEGRRWLTQALALREPLVDAVDLGVASLRLALAACQRPAEADAADRQIDLARQAFSAHPGVAPYLSQQLQALVPPR